MDGALVVLRPPIGAFVGGARAAVLQDVWRADCNMQIMQNATLLYSQHFLLQSEPAAVTSKQASTLGRAKAVH